MLNIGMKAGGKPVSVQKGIDRRGKESQVKVR